MLVGPSTAVTPAPRLRAPRGAGDENEIGIDYPGWGGPHRLRGGLVYHNAPHWDAGKAVGLTLGTSPERTTPESLTPGLSGFVHHDISHPVDR